MTKCAVSFGGARGVEAEVKRARQCLGRGQMLALLPAHALKQRLRPRHADGVLMEEHQAPQVDFLDTNVVGNVHKAALPRCVAPFSHRSYASYTLGGATKSTLREIGNGPYQALRKAVQSQSCTGCWLHWNL
jgi:hypothetical protein